MAEAQGGIFNLSSVSIPQTIKTRRGLPHGVQVADQRQMADYDDTTLIYDCFYSAERRQVIAYLPKMLAYTQLIQGAQFSVDNVPVKPTVVKRRLFDRLSFPTAIAPKNLQIQLDGCQLTLPVLLEDTEAFADQNCLYTIQKDQDLNWIGDWADFHVKEQGATAVLICDNGSTRYTPEDVLKMLRSVAGLRAVAVVNVPFSWGPAKGLTRRHGRTKFLQVAMMNAMRDRFLRKARAVLNCDVDELFFRKGTTTCFDKAARPLGFVAMNGEWRFAAPSDRPVRHVDHWMKEANPPSCAPKYCAAPSHGLGRLTWGIHGLEPITRRLMPVSKDFKMVHCRNISNSWKVDRTARTGKTLTPDEDLKERLEEIFKA
ncbi:hypothetical protein [Yoonia sp.]|uniref:hypothetical protein n=1 Tax=Yoonia sp. TaxID=2212373 RepID=UPI00358FB96D